MKFDSARRCVVCLLLLLLVACGGGGGSGGGNGNTGNQDTTTPPVTSVATEPGAEIDAPTTKMIGAAGGTMTSPTRDLTLVIPPGALASDTVITMTPITSTAHGAVGQAWRLGPDGTQFNMPVTLTFSYNDEILKRANPVGTDPIGTSPELLAVGFQKADGTWTDLENPVLDTVNKTVSVNTTHFTDYSPRASLKLVPEFASVQVSDSLKLQVNLCGASACIPYSQKVIEWSMWTQTLGKKRLNEVTTLGALYKNQDGTVSYYAPSYAPATREKVFIMAKVQVGSLVSEVSSYIFIHAGKGFHIHGSSSGVFDDRTAYIHASDSFDLWIPSNFPTGIFGNLPYSSTNYAPIPSYMALTNQPTKFRYILSAKTGCLQPVMHGNINLGNFTHLEIAGPKITLMGGSRFVPSLTVGESGSACGSKTVEIPADKSPESAVIDLTESKWQDILKTDTPYTFYSVVGNWRVTITPEYYQ